MDMEGVEVEVCNKKGFEGLWLVATIKRSLFNKNRVLVEYHTLLGQMESKPLQEYVDLSCLRPLPPKQYTKIFQLNEAVDAFCGQGWRKGVIRKVLEDSKYLIYFKNSEEEMEFKQGELRIHLEWVNGKWFDSEIREQCRRDGTNWRCREMSAPGKAYCEKHQMKANIRNEKRRKRPRESSPFSMEASGDDRAHQSSVDVMTNMNSCPIMEQDVRPPLKNQGSLFIKTSPVWGVLESMEVFKLVPQNPHFCPLEKDHEELREGIAIGHMINFANLMERTCKIDIDDPRSNIEMKLLALSSFEELGFTVEPIRSGLEELVKIKDSYHQFGDRLKASDEMINNERHQSDETQKSITRLNMELQALLIEKERKISEVAELQMTAEAIDGMVEGTRLDFYGVVTAPW
ncbi:hypothetical protein FRX31_019992 [Thalictrum thalictroides]|uniref:WRC domain-containing protein n=1 Tax=Thalictrum thalictroides TaxID=46969 RepID=A0A7J6VZ83_THATH|nr:hypothetical protein FRX31_019992 [Thalictrum thalictroides]